ncbi:MAG TPA: hypothetical protein VIM42_01795, partial [Clostridium sp.]
MKINYLHSVYYFNSDDLGTILKHYAFSKYYTTRGNAFMRGMMTTFFMTTKWQQVAGISFAS